VTLLARTAALALAIAVASQALAQGGPVLVCRYTGKVLDPCACPQRKGPAAPALQSQGCCEWRAAPPAVPAIAKAANPSPSRIEAFSWALPVPPLAARPDRPFTEPTARPQAPPGTPLYLTIRTLLI
jgi:hypothetical protein